LGRSFVYLAKNLSYMPRTKLTSSADVPVQVQNVDSSQASALNFADTALYDRMRSEVWHLAKGIPVFLVSPETMDQICPPELRDVLDPTCLKETLPHLLHEHAEPPLSHKDDDEDDRYEARESEKRQDAIDKIWSRLSRCRKAVFVAVGLYMPKGTSTPYGEGPIIFLCPERLLQWAKEERMPLPLALAKLYYHELAHAELDPGPQGLSAYDKPWGRLIEESLCNYLALSHFFDLRESRLVQRLMDSQPIEYRGYRHINALTNYFWGYEWELPRGWIGLGWIRGMPWKNELRRVAAHLRHRYPYPIAVDRLAEWIYDNSPLGSHESHRLAVAILQRGVTGVSLPHASKDQELLPPFYSLAPRERWRRYKADPSPDPGTTLYWQESALHLLHALIS
jgi:hypothetical protein